MNAMISNITNLPAIDTTASLARSAMLVDLSFSVWTGRKKDKATSEEVVASKNARSASAASVYNALLGDCKELDDITKYVSRIRAKHLQMTLPWSDSGTRILPVTMAMDYSEFISDVRDEFDRLVTNFLTKYDTLVTAAAFELGDLFNRDNYPTKDAVAAKFGLRCEYTPVPTMGDFRVDIDNQVMNEMVGQYEKVLQRRIEEGQRDLWSRLFEHLERMADRLQVIEGKPNMFKNTLVDGAVELIDLMDKLNATGDPELKKAQRQLKATLEGVDADTLRTSMDTREQVRNKVQEMLDAFSI